MSGQRKWWRGVVIHSKAHRATRTGPELLICRFSVEPVSDAALTTSDCTSMMDTLINGNDRGRRLMALDAAQHPTERHL